MTLIRPDLIGPPQRDLPRNVCVWGAGRAVRALLTVAALQGSDCRFRVWCRHHSRAELLRIHLADLPPLNVEIVIAETPPAGDGPLVLALGLRTSRRSRQKSKDALFDENLAIIEGLVPALRGRTVIVVTNPSTQLTTRLCSDGIKAFGIGVMNDQLRFERDGSASIRLVGAHNPFELGFGQLGLATSSKQLSFTRNAYRDLTNRQDRQRPLLDPDGLIARLAPRLHETAWQRLGSLHGDLDVARRWYARQRLASRYLENGIACGRAILALVDFVTGTTSVRPDLTVEAPMRFGDGTCAVVGWPWDSLTGQPRALSFDAVSDEVLGKVCARYPLPPAQHEPDRLTLLADGLPAIHCTGVGLAPLLADVVPLAKAASGSPAAIATICIDVVDDPQRLPSHVAGLDIPLQQVAQHRGKNAFEHRDLTIQPLAGNRRLLNFSASGARALIDDDSRQITLAVPPGSGRRDEFRKLLRDQILTPAYAAAGAWVLHAGLVSHGAAGLLLLGDSGAGKTTGALHLLGGHPAGGYGASERVLVFMRDGQLMALGVPESLTIFRGSLRGLPRFADLLEGQDPAADWTRARKLRLSRDDVVSRLGSHQIAEPIPVSHVALVRYDAVAAPGVEEAVSAEARSAALVANDLTTNDDVRAAWLNWYQPQRDPMVASAVANPALPFRVIDWSSPSRLAQMLAEFVNHRD